MATDATAVKRTGGGWPRGEYVLAGLAVLSLALIPIHITTIYSGLPAHPLLLHIPVILIPVAAVGALVFAVYPRWIPRYGIALGLVTVVALAGLFLTMGAGSALRDALHLNGGFGPSALVQRHAHAADQLRLVMLAVTAVLLVTVTAFRIVAGMPSGVAFVDSLAASATVRAALRIALAVLAIGCCYLVFHAGDLGAKAVWQGRLNGGAGGFGPGPPVGFGAPGGAGSP